MAVNRAVGGVNAEVYTPVPFTTRRLEIYPFKNAPCPVSDPINVFAPVPADPLNAADPFATPLT